MDLWYFVSVISGNTGAWLTSCLTNFASSQQSRRGEALRCVALHPFLFPLQLEVMVKFEVWSSWGKTRFVKVYSLLCGSVYNDTARKRSMTQWISESLEWWFKSPTKRGNSSKQHIQGLFRCFLVLASSWCPVCLDLVSTQGGFKPGVSFHRLLSVDFFQLVWFLFTQKKIQENQNASVKACENVPSAHWLDVLVAGVRK